MQITAIEYCRLKYALSRKELAILIGVDRVAVHFWEKKIFSPCNNHLSIMSELFKVSSLYLMHEVKVNEEELKMVKASYDWRHRQQTLRLPKSQNLKSKTEKLQDYFLSLKLVR